VQLPSRVPRRWSLFWAALTPVVAFAALSVWLALGAPASARLEGAGERPDGISVVTDGAYTLTVAVEPDNAPAAPGDILTYTVELRRRGGAGSIMAAVTNPLSSLVKPLGIEQFSFQTVGAVTPDRVRFQDSAILWRGQLGSNAALRFVYPVRIQSVIVITLDIPPPLTSTLTAFATASDGYAASASADTAITDAALVDPAKVDVSLTYVHSADVTPTLKRVGALAEFATGFVPGTDGFLRLDVTNANTHTAVLGLQGIFPSRNIKLEPLRFENQPGWTANFALTEDGQKRTLSFNIGMPPGVTQSFFLPVQLEEDLPPEAELVSRLGYCLTAGGPNCPGAPADQPDVSPAFQWLPPVTVTVKYRDLGDAPDSSNHAVAPMTAYPAVQADFPTVFDPATGAPPGPVHLNPRPFHLGRRVTPEAEADVGPDMDPTNNIEPALNVADRDRFDDGVPVHLLAFQSCQTTNIPVRVAIRAAAVNYFQEGGGKGYLNVWLDGDRDGDWADSANCSPVPGLPSVAPEHIVIDYEVDVVALGAGLHTLSVPTGRVPWPAAGGQSAWLRVTLSDRPVDKPLTAAGIAYGDGRGYATPFALGETEDYYYVPQGAAEAGADVTVEQSARWLVAAGDLPSLAAAASPFAWLGRLGTLVVKIDYQNIGTETAENVVLNSFVNEKLKDASFRISTVPEVNFSRTTGLEDVIAFDLGDLLPGLGGTAVEAIELKCPPYCCLTCTLRTQHGVVAHPELDLITVQPADHAAVTARQVFSNVVAIEGENDVDPANNSSVVEQEVLPAPLSLGFTYPGGDYLVRAGTTCEASSFMLGQVLNRYYLDQTLNVLVDGTLAGTVAVDDSGRFSYTLNLADGPHRVRVELPQDQVRLLSPARVGNPNSVGGFNAEDTLPHNRGAEAWYSYGTAAIRINVESSLPWNPISLTFTDEDGNVIRPAGRVSGQQDANGWTAQLEPGAAYVISLAYCGADTSPTIRASISGQQAQLTDPDGDGVFKGLIVMPDPALASPPAFTQMPASLPMELSIRSGAVESIYRGALTAATRGVVYDASTGAAVADAQVTALESNAPTSGDGLFDVWPAEDYGQTNPQTSGVNGAFSFWAPPGLYRLSAVREGYQPYQSWDLSVADDLLRDDLPLTPLVPEAADRIIQVGRDGFDPSWLRVRPETVVRWVNVDVADHTATSINPALTYPGTLRQGAWDSGLLSSADAYTLTFALEGVYTYADRANPRNTATIVVASENTIYLPLLMR
jgi:plastocyanin